jgi:hypothetical protein
MRDGFMAYAVQCHDMAARASRDDVRAQWLKLAASWLRLATTADQGADKSAQGPDPEIETVADGMGVGQDDSGASH